MKTYTLTKHFGNDITVKCVYYLKGKEVAKTLYLRFYFSQKNIVLKELLISTGTKLKKEEWNGFRVVCKDRITNEKKNKRLTEIETLLEKELTKLSMAEVQNLETVFYEIGSTIKEKITNRIPRGKRQLYLSLLESHKISAIAQSYVDGKNYSKGYIKKFGEVIKYYTEFNGGIEPTVKGISKDDVKRFKAWLERRMPKRNSVSTYMNKFRTLMLHAVDKDLIPKSPVPRKGLIEGYVRGKREVLSLEEVQSLCDVTDSDLNESMQKVKYLFLFMVAIGHGYGELKSINKHHLKVKKGNFYLQKDRKKTDEPFLVKLSPLAFLVYKKLEKWFDFDRENPFETMFSLEYLIRKLKKLAQKANINKNLTSYVSRHTFCTQWIVEGNNINVLPDIVGHADIRTTQIYCSILPDDAIRIQTEAFEKSKMHNIQLN